VALSLFVTLHSSQRNIDSVAHTVGKPQKWTCCQWWIYYLLLWLLLLLVLLLLSGLCLSLS